MSPKLRLAALLLIGLMLGADRLAAQDFQLPPSVPAQQRRMIERARRRQAGQRPSQPKKDESGKKGDDKKSDGDKKKDGKKGDGDAKDESKPVTRPNEPPRPPDPRELDAEPDASGRITFSFHGQPWADVLEWLARVSDLSLDWRELPGDYLNLSTQRSYSLAEARDLINRHLQARGYALLLSGEVLSVVKLDAVEPSLVPRVTEEELYDRQPHDLVKLSLELPPGLDVKQAVGDVKQTLGPHAKVMPLAATKRLLMIDSVANLRMVCAVLGEERMAAEGRVTPREFVLKHVQAPEVIDILYVVLGLDPNSRPSQMELRMQQQKLQLMQQMAQSGKDVMKMLKKDGPPVYLAYNRQRNSVLANAPEAEMRVIARTIEALDIPTGGAEASASMSGERLFRSYRLKTIKPQAVLETLREIGDLGPRTELQGDDASKTLFARATEGDHAKIQMLVDQLDGAETKVEVFWLRRLPAEAVAGSIQSLIINKPKEKKDDDYPWYYYRRRDNKKKEEPETILRVDADIENNRLIARGTPQQLDEVRDLLVKLGEPLPGEVDERRVRVLDALPEGETQQLLERLRKAWPEVGDDSELILPEAEPEAAPPADAAKGDGDKPATTGRVTSTESPPSRVAGVDAEGLAPSAGEWKPPAEFAEGAASRRPQPPGTPFRLLTVSESSEKPPVRVEVDRAGRIVLRSDNPAALDQLEALVDELTPPPKRYEVFPVRNRNPDDLVDSLKVYFEEFLKPEDDQVLDWFGRLRGVKQNDDEPVRLSRRRPLRFLSDDWSSTILVANATPAQLDEIARLIDAWDREPIDDRVITRRTATIKLRFARATSVVAALKEVYRDLLSRGDKEFDTAERKATGTTLRYLTQIRHGVDGLSEPAFIGFDGLLSLGADEAANVVIVSAREEVFQTVLDAIDDLDEQSRPNTTVQVRSLPGGASEELKQALVRALQSKTAGAAKPSNRQDQSGRQQGGRRRARPQGGSGSR